MFVRRPFLKGAKVWTWRGPYLTSNQAFTGKHVSFTRPSHMNIHARMCSQTHPGTLFYTILWIIIWTISKQRSVKKKNPNNKQTEKHLQIMVFGKKNSFFPPIRVEGKHSNHVEAKNLLKTMLLSQSDRHVMDNFSAVSGLPVTQSNQFWWVFFNTKTLLESWPY